MYGYMYNCIYITICISITPCKTDQPWPSLCCAGKVEHTQLSLKIYSDIRRWP